MSGADLVNQPYIEPAPAWRVMLGAKDLTELMRPRLLSLRLTEKRDRAADELEIVLHDHDGLLTIPPKGAVLSVEIGWAQGTGVSVGLVGKGTFSVTARKWSGPPDTLTLTARSADLSGALGRRRNRVWHGQTIGAIVGQIAADNGLVVRCHADLSGVVVSAIEQANKSDVELLRDLGRRYDAVATIKAGAVVFSPIGAASSPSGAALPALSFTRVGCRSYDWDDEARENAHTGAQAQYHDTDAAARVSVLEGDGANPKRLKRVYASRADASAAAKAEAKRIARAAGKFSVELAYGNPAIYPGQRAGAAGFKPEIDGVAWLVGEVSHSIGSDSFFTSVTFETAV